MLAAACAAVLFVSAVAKLIPSQPDIDGQHFLLPPHSPWPYLLAIAEAALAAGLLFGRYRRAAAIITSCFLVVGAAYALIRLKTGLPECGCFGTRVRFSTWTHLALVGATLCMLAPLHSVTKAEGS